VRKAEAMPAGIREAFLAELESRGGG